MGNDSVYKQMLGKYESGKNFIPNYLRKFFKDYMNEIKKMSIKGVNASDFGSRPRCFEKYFGEFLRNQYHLDVYSQVNLKEPMKKMNNITLDYETFIVKDRLSLEHFNKKRKIIDLIAVKNEGEKKIFFIEIKITPDISKFFDAFLEFSMITPPRDFEPHFIVLSDYGGEFDNDRDINRHLELVKEFEFVKEMFKKAGYFDDNKAHFMLLDPEYSKVGPKPNRMLNEDFFERLLRK